MQPTNFSTLSTNFVYCPFPNVKETAFVEIKLNRKAKREKKFNMEKLYKRSSFSQNINKINFAALK